MAACLDLLERNGAVVNLLQVRSDGWFERVGSKITNFDTVCAVMGDRFLAYAMILGVQINSLSTDPHTPANTTIEFTIGNDVPQMLTLSEFRVRTVQAIIQPQREPKGASLPLNTDDAIGLIGDQLILLAPLFGFSLKHLVLANSDYDKPLTLLGFSSETGFSFMELGEFESLIKQKVRRDLAGTQEEPFRLDLSLVEQARAAAVKGDYDRVITILEPWPGLLIALQRTALLDQLEEHKLVLIAEGLELLGNAFKERGRRSWSEELYRLGLTLVREGLHAGRLFYRLGVFLTEDERYGEAIGHLRRALAFGVAEREVFPALGRAFFRRRKLVAAAALLEGAFAQGADSPDLIQDLSMIREEFARAGITWDIPLRDSTPPR